MDTTTTNEVWNAVPGYEGFYEVSNLGFVRSVKRTYMDSIGRQVTRLGRDLKARVGVRGYPYVVLSKGGVRSTQKIHRIVVASFVQENIPENMVVCHLDRNKTNNQLRNLSIQTQKVNLSHRNLHGTGVLGERNNKAKLREVDIPKIRCDTRPYKQIAEEFGVSKFTISEIKRRKTWRHIK